MVVICRKLQAEFEWAIFPITSSDEYADRQPLENEPPEISNLLNEKWAKWRRLKPIIEHLSELQELVWESEIVLDNKCSSKVNDVYGILRQKYAHLSSGIATYFDLRYEQTQGREISNQQDFMRKLSHEIYSTKSDDFYKEIETPVDELATLLKSMLDKGCWFVHNRFTLKLTRTIFRRGNRVEVESQ